MKTKKLRGKRNVFAEKLKKFNLIINCYKFIENIYTSLDSQLHFI